MIQDDLAKTDITNGLRRSDLGRQGVLFLFISRVFAGWKFEPPEKMTGVRVPAADSGVESLTACVAKWLALVRSLIQRGPHRADRALTSSDGDACIHHPMFPIHNI